MFTRCLLTALFALSLAGCYGPIQPPPCVRHPGKAASVTVKRVKTIVGAPATMFLVVEGERLYGMKLGEQLTFEMDAGEHQIGFDLGFTRCRGRVLLESGHAYMIEMDPACDFEARDLGDTCPYPQTWPTRKVESNVDDNSQGF